MLDVSIDIHGGCGEEVELIKTAQPIGITASETGVAKLKVEAFHEAQNGTITTTVPPTGLSTTMFMVANHAEWSCEEYAADICAKFSYLTNQINATQLKAIG